MIGTKINKPITNYKQYADISVWCNSNNAKIEDKGSYYEVVENIEPTPTLKEQLKALENKYEMNRWQREIILAKNSGASDYTKDKAQEIENIAEQIRG